MEMTAISWLHQVGSLINNQDESKNMRMIILTMMTISDNGGEYWTPNGWKEDHTLALRRPSSLCSKVGSVINKFLCHTLMVLYATGAPHIVWRCQEVFCFFKFPLNKHNFFKYNLTKPRSQESANGFYFHDGQWRSGRPVFRF